MRNFQKANVNRRIVTIGFLTALMTGLTSAQTAAQNLDPPTPNGNEPVVVNLNDSERPSQSEITLEKIGPTGPQSNEDASEDKWALTDEDRMTEEEMDDELFGNSDPENKTQITGQEDDETQEDGEEEDASDEEGERSSDSGEPPVSKKETRLSPRKTIENYLKNINTLTAETYAPPVTSLDGVDKPIRRVPAQIIPISNLQTAANLRFQVPDIYHQPLYFEDQNAERSGVHRRRLHPVVSAGKFMVDGFALPRNLRRQPPRTCVHRENLRYSNPSLLSEVR